MTPACPLCGGEMEEVISFNAAPVRVGWYCTKCWPAQGSFRKAEGDERVLTYEDKENEH